jgi:hypothetical protein
MSKHYPVEQRERAVKMVLDHLDEYPSVYAACQAIGPKVGVGAREARRACNQPLGRPKALTDAKATQVRKLAVAGEPVAAIARTFGVGRTTVYRLINADTGED